MTVICKNTLDLYDKCALYRNFWRFSSIVGIWYMWKRYSAESCTMWKRPRNKTRRFPAFRSFSGSLFSKNPRSRGGWDGFPERKNPRGHKNTPLRRDMIQPNTQMKQLRKWDPYPYTNLQLCPERAKLNEQKVCENCDNGLSRQHNYIDQSYWIWIL